MMNKSINKNNLYYIGNSYVVEYGEVCQKVKPCFCFAHNQNFVPVFPITSRIKSLNSNFKRTSIPKDIWKGSKKSYLQIYDVKTIPKNTSYKRSFKVEREFSNCVRQSLIQNKRVLKEIGYIKKKIWNMEKSFE